MSNTAIVARAASLALATGVIAGCGGASPPPSQSGQEETPFTSATNAPAPSSVEKPVEEKAAKPATPSVDLAKARKEVEARFKGSKDEPTSKDAVWTSDSIFKVGVLDDDTDRSGYAQYVCEVLYEHGFKGEKVWVQVIDIAKLVRTNEWEKLGEAHCE